MGQSKRIFMDERERDQRPFYTLIMEGFLKSPPRKDGEPKKKKKKPRADA